MNFQALVDHALIGESTFLEAKTVALQGDRLEPHPESIGKALAALANSSGGHLLLGIDSERSRVTGVEPSQMQGVLRKLAEVLNDLVRPSIYFAKVDHGTVVDKAGQAHLVIVVEVPRSLHVHDVKGIAWVRVGGSTRELKGDARARLEMQRSQTKLMRFDEMPVPRATMADLNASSVERLLENARVKQLSALRLSVDVDGVATPNVSTILLLSDQPSRWLGGAYVQAALFRGARNDPADQVDAQRFEGSLDRQIIETWQFCKRHTRVRMVKDPARMDIAEYDEIALFEAIANALVHRDYSMHGTPVMVTMYSDRLEILSPGSLPNTMTLESMRQIPMPRNDLLVGVLTRYFKTNLLGKERFLVEGRVFGVPQILDRSRGLSGREPKYELIESLAVKLTIYPAAGNASEDAA